jgi:Fe-S-cluster containining protein
VFIIIDQPVEDDTFVRFSGDECGGKCAFDFDDYPTVGTDQQMTAGESFEIVGTEPETPVEEATLRIVWDDAESEQTATLAKWGGPEA